MWLQGSFGARVKLCSFEEIDNGGNQHDEGVNKGQTGALRCNCAYFIA